MRDRTENKLAQFHSLIGSCEKLGGSLFNRGLSLLAVVLVATSLSGCPGSEEEEGGLGELCYSDGTCDAPYVCDDGVCVETDEEQGGLGEPCYSDGTCDDDLVCDDGVCVERGEHEGGLGEPCYPDDTCDAPYVCEDDVCVETDEDQGGLGEPCYADGTCDDDLVCDEGVCVERGEDEGGLGEPCYPDGTCDDDLVCEDGTCQEREEIPDFEIIDCEAPMPDVDEGRCLATAGASDFLLMRGRVLSDRTVYRDGSVLVDESTGRITCVGCDCLDLPEAEEATLVECPGSVVSPGLIDPHEHLSFTLLHPNTPDEYRYDHRHDWRTGARGHPEISTGSSNNSRNAILYGELRLLLGGATSVAGSIGSSNASGLLRNLDNVNHTEGLEGVDVRYSTFPLGDVAGQMRTDGDCSYPNLPNPVSEDTIFLPHIAEGIDFEAQNEFHCLSSDDGVDMLASNASLVHAMGLRIQDIGRVAEAGAKVVWSPRSNISLYGHTTPVTAYHNLGVTVSLSTDWTVSGSMNMLREFACADYYNREFLGGFFTDYELWNMGTHAAAMSMGSETQIGLLAEDYFADLAIFHGPEHDAYRAVIEADVDDVVLVLRAGEPLYGDEVLIEALVPAAEIDSCEEMDVCGTMRRVCLERDADVTLADLLAVDDDAYPLFFCGQTPENEPTCHPSRPEEFTGLPTELDGVGDGIPDDEDLCPGMFTPLRPLDGWEQADIDGDLLGDLCDPCPFDPDLTCDMTDPNDFSGDGVPNEVDNCPFHFNPDQDDSTGDGYGDECDPCPGVYSPQGAPCPLPIQAVRDPSHPDHPAVNERVRMYGMAVTAVRHDGFFMQDPDATEPDFSAIFVYTSGAPDVELGDELHIVGRYRFFHGHAQLDWADVEVTGSVAVPEPFVVDPAEVATEEGGGEAEQERTLRYQSALLAVEDVEIIEENADDHGDYGEFRVTSGLRVNNGIYDYTEPEDIRVLGTEFERIVGVVQYSWDNTKLEPRGEEDLLFAE